MIVIHRTDGKKMIEIVFNENAVQALRLIKNRDDSSLKVGDIYLLNLNLDIGDITEITLSDISSRKDVLDMVYGYSDISGVGVSGLVYENNLRTTQMLMDIYGGPEMIRMWATEICPEEMCGICFIADSFRYAKNQLITAFVPVNREDGDVYTEISSTAEALDEDFFMVYGKYNILSTARRNAYSDTFRRMQMKETDLRIILNGRLAGVDGNFYDPLIISSIPDYPVPAGNLIARTNAHVPGVHSSYIMSRILYLVQTGALEEISPGDCGDVFSMIVRKAK